MFEVSMYQLKLIMLFLLKNLMYYNLQKLKLLILMWLHNMKLRLLLNLYTEYLLFFLVEQRYYI